MVGGAVSPGMYCMASNNISVILNKPVPPGVVDFIYYSADSANIDGTTLCVHVLTGFVTSPSECELVARTTWDTLREFL